MIKQLFTTSLFLLTTLFLKAQTNKLEDTGNVGIGTLNPNHELTVEGSASPNIELKNSNYSNGGFIINRTNYGNQWKWWAQSQAMYFSFATDEVNYSNLVTLKSNGYVGIGTTSPDQMLTVQGHVNIGGTGNSRLKTRHIDGKDFDSVDSDNLYLNYGNGKDVWVGSLYTGSTPSDLIVSGNVGIGTSSLDAELTVKGNIHTNEVKVDLLGAVAPDYVFYKNYDLKSLKEVENYIASNGHLPNIPSAKTMETEGLKLKEMNLKLLEKIEELTLYTIDQEKALKTQEKEIETSRNETHILKEKLENQEAINNNLQKTLKEQETRLQKIEKLVNSKQL